MYKSFSEYCAENHLEELLDQWDAEKNAPLTPEDIPRSSRRYVWWRCKKGHSWRAMVYTRNGRSGCPFCKGRLPDPGATDLASQRPGLAAEWDGEKNAPLRPSDVTLGSHRMVWWRCKKGHSWRAQVKSRVIGAGCPYCANKRVLAGFNSLADRCPALAVEWDAEKNAPLTPSEVLPGTRRKVWWRCAQGHSWYASVASRVPGGSGCPYCAGKAVQLGFNDLKSAFPTLAAQWDEKRNGSLTPESVTPYSNKRVWWLCPLGHSFRATVGARASGSGCPYCTGRKVLPGFNDLATRQPVVAAQWHPTLNGTLTPDQVTAGSRKKVWWQCSEGHVWKAVIYSRAGAKKCGCPVCSGRVSVARERRYAQ